jgi:two-component system OmpR family response regulator
MRRPGEVLTQLQLLEHAWDYGYESRSNVVEVYVRYLREKFVMSDSQVRLGRAGHTGHAVRPKE